MTVLFGHEQGKYPDGNAVVVRGANDSVVIDPALSVRTLQPPLSVGRILLTHAHEDHVAGVSAVDARTVQVHEADLPGLRSADGLMRLYGLPPDAWPAMTEMVTERFHFDGWPDAVPMVDGETLDLGGVTVTLVHAPGHTGGHSVYVIDDHTDDAAVRVVVTGDIDLSTFGPYYGDAVSSLDDFESTLHTVRDIVADHYVTFHHKGVIDGHESFAAQIDAYAAVFGRREQTLLDLLAEPRSLDELVADGIVYRAGTRPPVFGESVERRSIQQHLDRAIAAGLASFDGERYHRT